MITKKDIKDFVTISRLRNGQVKITHNITNESNIYELLRELGYRKTKVDNKCAYLLRNDDNIIPVTFYDIKTAFLNLLKKNEFINIPNDIESTSLTNWFYDKNPIKENGLLNHYLEDTLTNEEIHNYKLKTDIMYKHKFGVEQMLSKFKEWSFNKTVDDVGAFCKDNPLYYKRVDEKKYLVFNHFNSKGKTSDGFDCWLATFTNEEHIGSKKPIEIQDIRLSFHLDRDFQLIENYIN